MDSDRIDLDMLMNAFHYKITEGAEHQWHCFPYGRFLMFRSDFAEVAAIYSTDDQTVYQVEISGIQPNNVAYRWQNPDFKDAYYAEAEFRKVDPDQAWDDVKWVDVDYVDDFLEKATAVFEGDPNYEKRIKVAILLEPDLLLAAALKAHEMDLTLNEYFEHILCVEYGISRSRI